MKRLLSISIFIFITGCIQDVYNIPPEDIQMYQITMEKINAQWYTIYNLDKNKQEQDKNFRYDLHLVENDILPRFFSLSQKIKLIQSGKEVKSEYFDKETIEMYILPKCYAIRSRLMNIPIENNELNNINDMYITLFNYQINVFEHLHAWFESDKKDLEKLDYAKMYIDKVQQTYTSYKEKFSELNKILFKL
jgi:hypothetical protein